MCVVSARKSLNKSRVEDSRFCNIYSIVSRSNRHAPLVCAFDSIRKYSVFDHNEYELPYQSSPRAALSDRVVSHSANATATRATKEGYFFPSTRASPPGPFPLEGLPARAVPRGIISVPQRAFRAARTVVFLRGRVFRGRRFFTLRLPVLVQVNLQRFHVLFES